MNIDIIGDYNPVVGSVSRRMGNVNSDLQYISIPVILENVSISTVVYKQI